MEIELYHGTQAQNVNDILRDGLKSGSFASDAAFAWAWAKDKVIIATLPKTIVAELDSGYRTGPAPCIQYTLRENYIIPPQYLRLMTDAELMPHMEYAKSLKILKS